jgi:hypothetical protein
VWLPAGERAGQLAGDGRASGVRRAPLQHGLGLLGDPNVTGPHVRALEVHVRELVADEVGRHLGAGLGLVHALEAADGYEPAVAGVDRLVAAEAIGLADARHEDLVDLLKHLVDLVRVAAVGADSCVHLTPLIGVRASPSRATLRPFGARVKRR